MLRKGLIYYENIYAGEDGIPDRPDIIRSHRPCIVLNDMGASNLVTVAPITSNPTKRDGRFYHVPIETVGVAGTALVEQMRTVSVSELSRFPRARCSTEEIDNLDDAVATMFGFEVVEENDGQILC